MNKHNSQWVSASDVGRSAYCPHYLELKYRGLQPSKSAILLRKKGDEGHKKLNKIAQDKRCYIASYLYGYEDSKTNLLRKYRDKILINSLLGRTFISIYYQISPILVTVSQKSKIFTVVLKFCVDHLVRKIERYNENYQ